MIKRALTYFVLTLIVLQSAVAIGDVHQLYQSGTEHLVFDESHQHHDGNTLENQQDHDANSETSSSQKWDCHHCCHCHFYPAILISTERIHLAKNSSPVLDYVESTFPETYEAFLRPPKA